MKTLPNRPARTLAIIALAVSALLAQGCHRPAARTVDDLRFQIRNLQHENANLRDTIDGLRRDLSQCRRQVGTLQSIDPDFRDEAIATVASVELTRRSGIYPGPGGEPTLRVYLRPVDGLGDSIKAAGAAEIQLWHLDPNAPTAVLQTWRIQPDELTRLWSGTLMDDFYRFIWPLDPEIADLDDLTLRATFTDFLTGRTFTAQHQIRRR